MEERIERHIYRYVEAELENYTTYKKLVQEVKEEGLYSGAKSSLCRDITGRFSQNQSSDPTHKEAVHVLANKYRLDRQKDMITCIEDVLAILNDEQQKLIELRYFGGFLTDVGVMRELGMSRATYFREKRKLIKQFAIRMRLF